MFKPISTYRIQFNKDFNFKSLKNILPYLKKLGVDTIYASPIFEAVKGSTHGYDVINPLRINPEIGTEEELFAICTELSSLGISWIQDIVPNHMAFHPNNKWLMDVLKKGKKSEFASFFDIDFNDNKRLMVPFLGVDLDKAISNSELKIKEIDNEYYLCYGGDYWPVSAEAVSKISEKNSKEINEKAFIREIADMQFYRLCNWQETDHTINYRRFFTVNSLICLNIQHDENFKLYHQYIFELIIKGVFQGLRIDHIDGLFDPKNYLHQLRNAVGNNIYIVVEKILEANETMPIDWETQGTTGYDFLAITNNLFTDQSSKKKFDQIYQNVTGKDLDSKTLIQEKKKAILFEHMQGELNNLVELFISKNLLSAKEIKDIGKAQLTLGIAEMLINMPVYRYYNYKFPLEESDIEILSHLFENAEKNSNLASVISILKQVFLVQVLKNSEDKNIKLSQFYQRLMQFTGPLMAKGVEDTVMFTYNRFVGHTEVGDAPHAFGLSIKEFHQRMLNRQINWPFSLNGSSTHDTKKGEDFRARLNVITDIPEEWEKFVLDIQLAIERSKSQREAYKSVHHNDFFLILQTILGALPMPGEGDDDFQNRMNLYVEKALREAKKRSDWAEPDEEYEQLVKDFIANLLNTNEESFNIITSFLNRIADFGITNSLSQLLLKFTCPGIPDLYQGTELWDLSLVDPDNRRPVDYKKREDMLKSSDSPTLEWSERYPGKIKLFLTQKLNLIRSENQHVFTNGAYIPLETTGKYAANIFSFARKIDHKWLIVAVPLGLASLTDHENILNFDWVDTQIILPKGAPIQWDNLITGKREVKDILSKGVLINQIFGELQFALIELKEMKVQRSAGVLMHITSLPSSYGIGDFGSEAIKFVDFLKETNQRYWQLLPLNPTKKENGHSPYSSNSSKAGNVLLIDLDFFGKEGLLDQKELNSTKISFTENIDFAKVEILKFRWLHKAYENFIKSNYQILKDEYLEFCQSEKSWLDDFALYTSVKNHHDGLEWYNWDQKFKIKDKQTLKSFNEKYPAEIDEVKWQQFIFFKQWHQLKNYANDYDVKIIGDLPFYLDYDSVEVWSQPNLFKLDENLKPTHVAGVPPDYFNESGQLWGMPIFNWKLMKKEGYSWWINRLHKNMEMFDLLRLDHFRAFSSFWEVPAGDKDATKGTWQEGPGIDFFNKIKKEFPEMPFIAEDLGEITDDVEALRDQFDLPGMKVLQFSFGADLISTPHIPHNFQTTNCIVYSGTHDNNTLKGWFLNEIDGETRNRVTRYLGRSVNEKNIYAALITLAYSSTAKIAILPIQDILVMGEETRMNTPGQVENNWLWRLNVAMLSNIKTWLSEMTETYGRL